jgi:Ser/Thr protein kinase RdoA (MazF antagonist)
MSNMRIVTDHIFERLKNEQQVNSSRRWEVPHIISAKDDRDFFIDSNKSFWRAMSFINASTGKEVKDAEYAREVGYGLGRFHSLVSDLDTEKLYDILEGFHITPEYLRSFDEAVKSTEIKEQSSRARYCLSFISERRKIAFVLEEAKDQKRLLLSPIHGDPKFDNIMIDRNNRQAVGIIDLDTVKPGLVHYDIGDCLRSCCNPLGEEPKKLKDVHFRTDFCKAVLEGYLAVAHRFLTENDYFYLYDSIRLIPFELGLRFFTDYLRGNVYFKVNNAEDNLYRALVQFQLTESIESQESDICSIIDDLKRISNR